MDKQQIISFIESQLKDGKITPADLMNISGTSSTGMETVQSASKPVVESSSKNLINTFYSIGGIVAVIGVGILVSQHWNEIGFIGRLLVSIGISFVSFVTALILNKPAQRIVSEIMFFISAALAPLGAYVLLKEAGIFINLDSQLMTALVLAIIYAVALWISKKKILVLITIAFATWAYYALVLKLFGTGIQSVDMLKWATMLLGASYILIAFGYQSSSQAEDQGKTVIKNILYGLGTLGILGAGIWIGGVFDLVYILFIFAAFYASVFLKSRAMLLFGALFLMGHIIKLTARHFVGSIGWPVALIVVGFLIIGVGYGTFYLNKKFISQR